MPLVLVIEDRAPDRELLVQLLSHAGYRVLACATGPEALRLTHAQEPDLVIADMLVPEMDGLEFARAVRADPAIADTPIMLYTATYESWELERLARAVDITVVLEKPADPKVILRTVEELLAAPPPMRDPYAAPADA